MKKKSALIWDEWNREHMKKHAVTTTEVEQVYASSKAEKQSYLGRKIIFGPTKKDRLLAIVLSSTKQTSPYVVSARDMSKKERRWYHEKTQSTQTIQES